MSASLRRRLLGGPCHRLVVVDENAYPLSFQIARSVIGNHVGHLHSIYAVTAGSGSQARSKVGFSTNVDYRLANLRASSPVPIRVAGVWDVPDYAAKWVEKAAHDLLRHKHSHSEWFRVDQWTACAAVVTALGFLPSYKKFWSAELWARPEWKAAVAEFKALKIVAPTEPPIP